jgi:hypothetical protein
MAPATPRPAAQALLDQQRGPVAVGQRLPGRRVRADLDPQLAGTLLLDAYVGTVLRWIAADPPPFPLGDTPDEVCATILHGLRR